MGLTVREAQERISVDEFRHWLAYDRIDPIGNDRFDVLFAMLTSTLANCHRSKKQSAYKLEDFIPRWGSKSKQGNLDKMRAVMHQYAARTNSILKVKDGTDRNT